MNGSLLAAQKTHGPVRAPQSERAGRGRLTGWWRRLRTGQRLVLHLDSIPNTPRRRTAPRFSSGQNRETQRTTDRRTLRHPTSSVTIEIGPHNGRPWFRAGCKEFPPGRCPCGADRAAGAGSKLLPCRAGTCHLTKHGGPVECAWPVETPFKKRFAMPNPRALLVIVAGLVGTANAGEVRYARPRLLMEPSQLAKPGVAGQFVILDAQAGSPRGGAPAQRPLGRSRHMGNGI